MWHLRYVFNGKVIVEDAFRSDLQREMMCMYGGCAVNVLHRVIARMSTGSRGRWREEGVIDCHPRRD